MHPAKSHHVSATPRHSQVCNQSYPIVPSLQIVSIAHVAFDRIALLAAIGRDKDEGDVLALCRLSGCVQINVKKPRRNSGSVRFRMVCNGIYRL